KSHRIEKKSVKTLGSNADLAWLIKLTSDKAAPACWLSVAAACGLVVALVLYRRGREAAVA
ncbi:MAG TPA: hypothetical protein VGI11_03085, partial [Variovorax sp.]